MTVAAAQATLIPQGFKALPLSIAQLSLAAVLKCGQSFRWSSFPPFSESESGEGSTGNDVPSHEWRFCLKDRVVCLRQSEDFLYYRSLFPRTRPLGSSKSHTIGSLDAEGEKDSETLAFIRDYFQLDTDLLKLYDTWGASDPVFRGLRGRFKGIRMLRQDPWECLISFICSSNNNISRISKMVQNLCTHFSPLLDVAEHSAPGVFNTGSADTQSTDATAYYPFPPPSALSSPSVSAKLRQLGFGYRADFIQKTAAMLLEAHGSDEGVFAFLEGLRKVATEKAREELVKCMGVGRKVADCVLLMSLDKAEVVPVDTHVHQIVVKHYGMRGSSSGKTPVTPRLYDEVNARLAKIWGSYAGWAHSVLFTADLKSFSTYGLPTPSPSPLASPSKASSRASSIVLAAAMPTPPETPSNTPQKKRKRKQAQSDAELITTSFPLVRTEDHSVLVKKIEKELEPEASTNGSLAERVKRRRRISVKSESTKGL